MPFKNIQIRFQTARSLPAPYANFYTLTARPAFKDFLQVDFAITYPDREDIDEDELIAEGFSPDDDFSWSGRLPLLWQKAVTDLVDATKLAPFDEDVLDEDDDFWEITIERPDGQTQKGMPENVGDWQYLAQELIQATYESAKKELPFELTFIDRRREGETELRLTALFAERTVKAQSVQNKRSRTHTLSWAELQGLMSEIYAVEFDPDEAVYQKPRQDGAWLNLGGEEWYSLRPFPELIKLLSALV
ncbi:hypothetical protein [Arsenicibacter rosenii]|uniref:Uncharacterized protein n=1 Tax=Arsenicibacter rosenii TaxID=1750698 RepID=A0A1S2VMB6_9BACT|nr:hypothetical protein [Arsenicibacter rosenii]OIN59912.1 hypothetical protein BLX24_08685 [Arsenicibacter rosenii]